MPGVGPGDGKTDLLNKNEEHAGIKSRALDFSGRPEIVSNQAEQEDVGKKRGPEWIAVREGDGPAGECGDQERVGGDEDEALVSSGVRAEAEGAEDKNGENQYIGHGNDIEKLWIEAGRGGAVRQGIRCGQDAEHNHQAGEKESGDAEATVDVRASSGDETGLGDEQEDPAGECGAVDVNDEAGKWSMENAGQVVAVGKADKHREEHQDCHGGEK